MSVRVKICGITNLDDALAAVEAGTDALGFVFCETSSRCVSRPVAGRIIERLPPFVSKVGVFVNAPEEFIRTVVEQCGIDTLQLHGDESPEFCRLFRCSVIKAFRMCGEQTIERAREYQVGCWLLDSFVPGQTGGTGQVFNWDLARRAAAFCPSIILAGGLTPANVAEAINRARPYAVDVSSGVESKPGKKDHGKVREFIRAAKSVGANQSE